MLSDAAYKKCASNQADDAYSGKREVAEGPIIQQNTGVKIHPLTIRRTVFQEGVTFLFVPTPYIRYG
ncbi:hypothetical protein [Kosakonia oryzendophytica]|uniref:hypothetical protein n=1 Tax=Kosakonia oryzendophytica TaxID=1005665 RepID=UPI000B4A4BC9|nr:hypothetical protein [Kosakonia oryzendophytica]